MTPMPPGGGQPDLSKILMMLKGMGIDPSKLMGGGAPGGPIPGGPGGTPLGGAPPALNAGTPGGPMPPPSPGMPGGNSVPGLSPGAPPSPGGQSPFGPPPGSAMPPPDAGDAPGVTPPSPGGGNPQMDMTNMVLGQAAYGGPERGLDRQMKMADELRNTATPGMLGGGGRVQTAASPLEFAGAALGRIGGQKMSNDVADKQQQMFKDRMERLRKDMTASRGIADQNAME